MGRNLVNLEGVSKAFDIRPLLTKVSIGVSEGDRGESRGVDLQHSDVGALVCSGDARGKGSSIA